jgi:hypothetical protein
MEEKENSQWPPTVFLSRCLLHASCHSCRDISFANAYIHVPNMFHEYMLLYAYFVFFVAGVAATTEGNEHIPKLAPAEDMPSSAAAAQVQEPIVVVTFVPCIEPSSTATVQPPPAVELAATGEVPKVTTSVGMNAC